MKLKVNKKKVSIILVIILSVFLTGNAFAALVGAPNIFFAIKDMVIKEEVSGEENLLVDRDITISYSPIKIKNGLELQVNRILIEKEKSTLFITLDNKNDEDEQLGINVYDLLENNNTNDVLAENKFLVQKEIKKNFEIELSKSVSTEEKLLLEIIIGGKSVGKNIIVDLASKEIIIEGKEEVKKLSEVELKKYLGCFSILNYEDLKLNDRLIYIAHQMNYEIFQDKIETNSQRELIMNIVDSFYSGVYTTDTVNGIEILKPNNQQYSYKEDLDAYTLAVEDAELPRGLCLGIEDISYEAGVYTVEYIYVHPTKMEIENNKIEDLEQYKSVIKLELNEDTEYSKFKIVDISEGKVVAKEDKIESNVTEAFATKQSECKKLLERYLKILYNTKQNALNLPIEIGLADKYDIRLYELVSLQGELNDFYDTEIEYSKYEKAMSKYMTKECMDNIFSEYTRNLNDTLYISATSDVDWYYEIKSFDLESNSGNEFNYKGQIIVYTLDHEELQEFETVPKDIEIKIVKENDKFLIDDVVIHYINNSEKTNINTNTVNTNTVNTNTNTVNTNTNTVNTVIENNRIQELNEPEKIVEQEERTIDGTNLIDFAKEHGTVYYGVSTDRVYEVELIIYEDKAFYNLINPGKTLMCVTGKYTKSNNELTVIPTEYCTTDSNKFQKNESMLSHTFIELSDGSYRLKDDSQIYGEIVLNKDKSVSTRVLEPSFSNFNNSSNWNQITGKYIFEKAEKNGETVMFDEIFGNTAQVQNGDIELKSGGSVTLQLPNKTEYEFGTFLIGSNNEISMITDSITGTQTYDPITKTLILNYNDYKIYARFQ